MPTSLTSPNSATSVGAPSASGSPFSPGIPLEAHQAVFGREDAFQFIAGEITRFKSVNLIGERRIGKTSVLKHLIGNRDKHLAQAAPSLVLVSLDMQGIQKAEQFYGKAMLELMDQLLKVSANVSALVAGSLADARLIEASEASVIQFENFLKNLHAAEIRPVLLIDEFQRVFEPHLRAGFPFPDFFDGLRAQITANRLAMVIFTHEKLIEYFDQQSLSSTFPSYFIPFRLETLSVEAADQLLLQPSDHPLTTEQARTARKWAGLYPCALQCAGSAWYEANATGKDRQWAKKRYKYIVAQNDFVPPDEDSPLTLRFWWHLVKQPKIWLPLSLLSGIGLLAWLQKMHWLTVAFTWGKNNAFAVALIFLSLGILFGKINGTQVLKVLLDKITGGKG